MPKVIVVGGGNAALCAAISAREHGADVVLLERAPHEARGGNSRFAGGGLRTVYDGAKDLLRLMPDLSDSEMNRAEVGSYTRENFLDDLGRMSRYRIDPDLAEKLVDESLPTLQWMQQKGVKFLPLYRRQSFNIDGKHKFWGGLTIEAWGGGAGLVEMLTNIANANGVELRYDARVTELVINQRNSVVEGVVVGGEKMLADSVVLACGGFESNAAWRAQYLGPNWDLARVRGTRFNTGDGIEMAIEAGAMSRGHWSGCHSVAWDVNAPEFGDLDVGDSFQKHSYPLGVVVNTEGKRFMDEGRDFRNYTYAEYGAKIIEQPEQIAWQVFDASVSPQLRDEYRVKRVTRVSSSTLHGLAKKMEGVDERRFLDTVSKFNQSVRVDIPFNPAVKDGRSADDGVIAKSNWANPLSSPPFEAYGVTCGITFTFGGLHVDSEARVINASGSPISNLFAAGEIVGGLYYFNYAGGSGLTSGAVFGRTAGRNAARRE